MIKPTGQYDEISGAICSPNSNWVVLIVDVDVQRQGRCGFFLAAVCIQFESVRTSTECVRIPLEPERVPDLVKRASTAL